MWLGRGGAEPARAGLGRAGDELAEIGLAGVAADALQGARRRRREREPDPAAVALVTAGGPELTVAGKADRVRPLAVARRPQRHPENGRRQGQGERREGLE